MMSHQNSNNGVWYGNGVSIIALIVSISILGIAANNFLVNLETLEIAKQNYENNRSNANDSAKIVELLENIKNKL